MQAKSLELGGRKEKKITWVPLCQIMTSCPSLGTQSHLSSGLGIVWECGWVGYHEAFDAGGRWCRTPSSGVRVPAWHDAIDLRAFEVGCFAGGSRVVGATTKAALPMFGTIDGAVVGENFPTLVAEVGVQGTWAAIRVVTVLRFEGGFIGKNLPEHTHGDLGVDESVGGSEKVIVVVVEALLEIFGVCGELLLQGYLCTVPRDIRGQPWVLYVVDVAVDHFPEL